MCETQGVDGDTSVPTLTAEKRWLRFYWWRRNLQEYIKSDYRMDASSASALGWSARPGAGSTNIYDKALIRPIIDALKDCQIELGWE